MKTKRKLRKGERRCFTVGKDGVKHWIIYKVKHIKNRKGKKYKYEIEAGEKRALRLRGRVSLLYRITEADDALQYYVKKDIEKSVLKELGLWTKKS